MITYHQDHDTSQIQSRSLVWPFNLAQLSAKFSEWLFIDCETFFRIISFASWIFHFCETFCRFAKLFFCLPKMKNQKKFSPDKFWRPIQRSWTDTAIPDDVIKPKLRHVQQGGASVEPNSLIGLGSHCSWRGLSRGGPGLVRGWVPFSGSRSSDQLER